jgi:hypothetical protein
LAEEMLDIAVFQGHYFPKMAQFREQVRCGGLASIPVQ